MATCLFYDVSLDKPSSHFQRPLRLSPCRPIEHGPKETKTRLHVWLYHIERLYRIALCLHLYSYKAFVS